MAKRIGGMRRKTRHKLLKDRRKKGKINSSKFFQEFSPGQQVCLGAEPAVQGGMYYPKFMGKVGRVIQKKGRCVEVAITDAGKSKTVIVHPVHLRRIP